MRPKLKVFSVEGKRLVRPPQSAVAYFLIFFEPDEPAIRRVTRWISACVLAALLFIWLLYWYVVSLGTFKPVPGFAWVVQYGWIAALVISVVVWKLSLRHWLRRMRWECELFRIQGGLRQHDDSKSGENENAIAPVGSFELNVSSLYENVGAIQAYAKSVKHRRRIIASEVVLDCLKGQQRTAVVLIRFASDQHRDEFCDCLNRYGVPEVGSMDVSDYDSTSRAIEI